MRKYGQRDWEKNETVSGRHARKVKELFHNAFSEEIWVSVDELYEDIWQSVDELYEDIRQNSDLKTPYKVAKLNILTRSMLEYDRSYFMESSFAEAEDYRPYFYSYIIQIDSLADRNKYNRLLEMGDRWFLASFSQGGYDWNEYEGEIESSASPVIYRRHAIYISDISLDPAVADEINYTYKMTGPASDRDIEKEIALLLQDVEFKSSRVYAVGNGNLIDISGSQNGRRFDMMYDVGYHSRQSGHDKRYTYGAAVRSFQHIVPGVVFLSHWDDDHIMGCVYANSKLFDRPWIAPEIVKKRAIGARRLAAYLTKKGKLVIVKRENNARRFARVVTPNSTVSFYLGENRSKQSITKENCGGMVIEILTRKNGRNIESLFCGDVPYEAVKTVIWSMRAGGYDNLVVPHHGSAMNCSALKVKNAARAVVCGDGSVNRPQAAHKDALEAGGAGYHVEVTENARNYPWIDLNLQ